MISIKEASLIGANRPQKWTFIWIRIILNISVSTNRAVWMNRWRKLLVLKITSVNEINGWMCEVLILPKAAWMYFPSKAKACSILILSINMVCHGEVTNRIKIKQRCWSNKNAKLITQRTKHLNTIISSRFGLFVSTCHDSLGETVKWRKNGAWHTLNYSGWKIDVGDFGTI